MANDIATSSTANPNSPPPTLSRPGLIADLLGIETVNTEIESHRTPIIKDKPDLLNPPGGMPGKPVGRQLDQPATTQPGQRTKQLGIDTAKAPTLGGKESTGGFRTSYIGIKAADQSGQYIGQVEVQFNPKTNQYTAYGLGGQPVQLPAGVTREQIASGQLTKGLALIPMAGPGADGGASHITAIMQAMQDFEKGKLDAETIKRVNNYVGGLAVSASEGGESAGWSAQVLDQLIKLLNEFADKQQLPAAKPAAEPAPEPHRPKPGDIKPEPHQPGWSPSYTS